MLEKGLDPVQVYAAFNYSGIKNEERIKQINALFKALDVDCEVTPTTLFEGIPSPIITRVIGYRGWSVQNEIWEMFHAIAGAGIDALAEEHFTLLKDWKGLDIASFTMFLFWINSEQFLPLDKNTVGFLIEFKLIEERPREFNAYYEVCLKTKLQTGRADIKREDIIREFVKDAYKVTKKEVDEHILSASTRTVLSQQLNLSDEQLEKQAQLKKKEYFKGFRIIAIRPHEKPVRNTIGKKQKHLKNLTAGEFYSFYECYDFQQGDQLIPYDDKLDVEIYDHYDEERDKHLNISVSAIVGKNGSGKSTLVELLYLVINKIAYYKKIKSTERLVNEEVFADLYFKSDKLYKVSVGNSVKIFEYEALESGKVYSMMPDSIDVMHFDMESFCYSLVINYSLYGLNSTIIGRWINSIFHKNDSYQVPIVLNPKRDEGNIDVNKEEDLAKSRLLANLLDPENHDTNKQEARELVPRAIPQGLILSIDKDKMDRKRESYEKNYNRQLKQSQIESVMKALQLYPFDDNDPLVKIACEYIYFKLVSISAYPRFKNYKNLSNWVESNPRRLNRYANALLEDDSHITFKLHQAINFVKYGLYAQEEEYDIFRLSKNISELKEKEAIEGKGKKSREIRTIELTPPSFLKPNIRFKHGGSFDELSSGEKQQILSVNTVAYHLLNIDSAGADSEGYKYNCVNIVFDEIELYFHPEMQRTFLKSLRERIISLKLQYIDNINILFVTHSPFILSDLAKSHVLKLAWSEELKRIQATRPEKPTFGANIHELLTESFFLSSSVGEYAKDRINEIIEFYADTRKTLEEKLEGKRKEYVQKRSYFEKIKDSIGEVFLKNILKNHLEFLDDYLNVKTQEGYEKN